MSITNIVNYCDICGRPVPRGIVITQEEDKIQLMCPACANAAGTCATCLYGVDVYCYFETDPSPTPKTVTKTIRNGNMQFIAQVKNPDRVRETCQKCQCSFGTDFECQRQIATGCAHFHLKGL